MAERVNRWTDRALLALSTSQRKASVKAAAGGKACGTDLGQITACTLHPHTAHLEGIWHAVWMCAGCNAVSLGVILYLDSA